jgi:hypothetical protein
VADQVFWLTRGHASEPDVWYAGTSPDGSPLPSILIDPPDPNHMYIATSAGGVFESREKGADWEPFKAGCRADFLPDPHHEYGQDTRLTCPWQIASGNPKPAYLLHLRSSFGSRICTFRTTSAGSTRRRGRPQPPDLPHAPRPDRALAAHPLPSLLPTP